MGVSSNAMLYGNLSPVRICAALRAAGYESEPVRETSPGFTQVSLTQFDGRKRTLYVLQDSPDNADVFAGIRTSVILGSDGESGDIVRVLAQEFGGYHRLTDNHEFTRETARGAVELTPEEALRVALAPVLGEAVAAGVSKAVAHDADALACVRDALEAHAYAIGPSPRP